MTRIDTLPAGFTQQILSEIDNLRTEPGTVPIGNELLALATQFATAAQPPLPAAEFWHATYQSWPHNNPAIDWPVSQQSYWAEITACVAWPLLCEFLDRKRKEDLRRVLQQLREASLRSVMPLALGWLTSTRLWRDIVQAVVREGHPIGPRTEYAIRAFWPALHVNAPWRPRFYSAEDVEVPPELNGLAQLRHLVLTTPVYSEPTVTRTAPRRRVQHWGSPDGNAEDHARQ